MEHHMQISILGSTGQMGDMFMKRLINAGHHVKGIDIPYTDEILEKSLCNAQIVMLCVPAHTIRDICCTIQPFLPLTCLLIDITSVKILPINSMEEFHKGPVIGTHPLFGPRSQEYRRVCLCQGSWFEQETTKEYFSLLESMFHSIQCETFSRSAKEHDEAMAAIQGLNFVTNVAYFAMTAQMNDLSNFLTPSFHRRLESARTLISQDGDLFMGIFDSNPMSQDMVRQFQRYMNIAASGDMSILLELAKKWFNNPN